MPLAGSNYYGQFTLSNPTTGVAQNADSLPTATATHNGVVDASFVLTVINVATGLYTVSGTIPGGYAVGDWVSVSVSATVAGSHGVAIIETFVVTTTTVIAGTGSLSSGALATVYCTDEQIAVRAGGDFALLCPKWQKLAYGAAGAFASGFPWLLTDSTTSFGGTAIGPGSVVWLTKPATSFRGGGELFGVDSAIGSSLTLHRVGLASGAGLPPGAATGLTGVEYTVLTLAPQIEEVSFALNRQYMIDPNVPGRTPSNIYDLRDLRQACILTVLTQRIAAELQDKSNAAWAVKLQNYRSDLDATLGRLQLRWGNKGDSQPPSTLFSTRFVR